MHINKLDDSKYKESSEESSLPRLRGRLLQSCRAHCLSSKAQTCCGQPVLPLVFLSLLLTVLFKISFWGGRMRREREREGGERNKAGRGEKKQIRELPPLPTAPERESCEEEPRAPAEACGAFSGRPPRGLAAVSRPAPGLRRPCAGPRRGPRGSPNRGEAAPSLPLRARGEAGTGAPGKMRPRGGGAAAESRGRAAPGCRRAGLEAGRGSPPPLTASRPAAARSSRRAPRPPAARLGPRGRPRCTELGCAVGVRPGTGWDGTPAPQLGPPRGRRRAASPPRPVAARGGALTSSFFLFSSFTSVFLISALKASASPFWSSFASRSMR